MASGGGGITKIVSPQELINKYRKSIVLISSIYHEQEIRKQLSDAGYPSERVYSYKSVENIFLGDEDCNYQVPELNIISAINEEIKNIVIFGTELSGINILNLLRQSIYKNKKILFCDEDQNKRDKIINNVKVISVEDLIEYYGTSFVIISDLSRKREIHDKLVSMGHPAHRIFFPRTRTGIYSREYVLYGLTGWQYFDYFEPHENEIFVDGGCYDGKTAIEFTKWATKGYDYIYSFEANSHSIKDCEDTFNHYKLKGEIINKGLWDKREKVTFEPHARSSAIIGNGIETIETISLDEFLNGKRVTFIKMDIEGSEYKALLGAKETIRKWHPRLAICVYHKPEDILEIPALLLDIQSDYKFALRHHSNIGIEAVLYAY
ncbi:MAG: FkbM family methyltransferase [Selenomonadaceae bacterium]|nr:FkbM family methyltransferase [Selenomonadaceae bacterium]